MDAGERLGHAPGDFNFHLLGVGKHAGFLAHKVEGLQPQALAGAAGHAGHISQVVVDDVNVGSVHVDGDGLFDVAVEDDPAFIQHHAAGAQLADGGHVVADVEHGAAVLVGDIAHFAQAFLLELHVAHGQDLVHDHDLAVQMGSDGEGQLDEHAAGIALDGGVDEVAALRKFDDLGQFGVDLGLGHAQDRAVHIDVFAAGHFVVEAGADFQHGGHAAANFDLALGGGGDAGQQLEQRGFARAVAADDAQGLALVDGQVHAVQCHKSLAEEALVGANDGVGVLFAADARPPALQVVGQRAAADLAEFVLLF